MGYHKPLANDLWLMVQVSVPGKGSSDQKSCSISTESTEQEKSCCALLARMVQIVFLGDDHPPLTLLPLRS